MSEITFARLTFKNPDAVRKVITMPYTPEDHVDTFGWLWMRPHKGEAASWHLVETCTDRLDPETICICFYGTNAYRNEAADTWAGLPYMPCTPPKCEPGTVAMLTTHLPGGSSVTLTSCNPRGEAAFKTAIAAAINALREDATAKEAEDD
jgi:hypothetical protein